MTTIKNIDTSKPYITWVNNGSEGWSPHGCDTLEEAFNVESYGSEKIITKCCNVVIMERE